MGVVRRRLPDDVIARRTTYRWRVQTFRPPWARHGRRLGFLGIFVAVVQVGITYVASRHQPDAQPLDALAYVLLAGTGLALPARRRHPSVVLAAVAAGVVTYHALNYANGPIFLSLVIALVGAVLGGHRRAAWTVAAAAFVGYFALARIVGRADAAIGGQAAGIGVWLLLILVVAEFARSRRDQAVEAFHTRAEENRRKESEERLRVARELHDVLAHNISLINVQAGVALHLMDERPEQARTALTAIKQASKDALGELRSVLGVLRQPDDEAPLDPAPSLERLDALLNQARTAGLDVRVDVDGTTRPLPTPVDLAAFRIIQEALTNVTKHAGPASVVVQVRYRDEQLVVVVDDDGPRSGVAVPIAVPRGTGRGIVGMRERATGLGGEIVAGPRPGGGFHVMATLPLEVEG
jgi:signal transduction histidine kinase